jgi:hypothetical protein
MQLHWSTLGKAQLTTTDLHRYISKFQFFFSPVRWCLACIYVDFALFCLFFFFFFFFFRFPIDQISYLFLFINFFGQPIIHRPVFLGFFLIFFSFSVDRTMHVFGYWFLWVDSDHEFQFFVCFLFLFFVCWFRYGDFCLLNCAGDF